MRDRFWRRKIGIEGEGRRRRTRRKEKRARGNTHAGRAGGKDGEKERQRENEKEREREMGGGVGEEKGETEREDESKSEMARGQPDRTLCQLSDLLVCRHGEALFTTESLVDNAGYPRPSFVPFLFPICSSICRGRSVRKLPGSPSLSFSLSLFLSLSLEANK